MLDLSDVPHDIPPIMRNSLPPEYSDNSRKRPVKQGTTPYMGVSYQSDGKFRAQIFVLGKIHNLGSYATPREAAIVYARAAYKYKARRVAKLVFGPIDLRQTPSDVKPIPGSNPKVKYKGVKLNKARYSARISYQGRVVEMGTYDTPEEAGTVYARAAIFVNQMQAKKVNESDRRDSRKTDVDSSPPLRRDHDLRSSAQHGSSSPRSPRQNWQIEEGESVVVSQDPSSVNLVTSSPRLKRKRTATSEWNKASLSQEEEEEEDSPTTAEVCLSSVIEHV